MKYHFAFCPRPILCFSSPGKTFWTTSLWGVTCQKQCGALLRVKVSTNTRTLSWKNNWITRRTHVYHLTADPFGLVLMLRGCGTVHWSGGGLHTSQIQRSTGTYTGVNSLLNSLINIHIPPSPLSMVPSFSCRLTHWSMSCFSFPTLMENICYSILYVHK